MWCNQSSYFVNCYYFRVILVEPTHLRETGENIQLAEEKKVQMSARHCGSDVGPKAWNKRRERAECEV